MPGEADALTVLDDLLATAKAAGAEAADALSFESAALSHSQRLGEVEKLEREESRGAHSRLDFPDRNDEKWLKHTLAWKRDGKISFDYKPVVITRFQPKERTY